ILQALVFPPIEDPSCFWIAVKECAPGIVNERAYENLNTEMNQFYDNYKDSDEIKPEEIEKGQVYVVFSEELRCWCRALVQSVRCRGDGYQLGCFLVDHAKYYSVASENIRVLAKAFAKIPYRAKKCCLYCTKPLTLHIDFCENTCDKGLIFFFLFLLHLDATEVKATIQVVKDKVLEVFLFVTVRDEKVRFFYISNLVDELDRNKFSGPTFTESYCWPPVTSGYDIVAISHQGNDPLLYIPSVLTLLQLKSASQALPNTNGPLALILCPGWKKAQLVFDLLKRYGRCCRHLYPMLIILGQNKEAASQVEIRGCEVVVTTPYNLLRLLEHHTWLLCRLCHLVLDEIEVLFSDTTEQVFTILDCYKKAAAQPRGNLPHQIIAVGTQWNKHITPLMKEFMRDPYVVITVVEEAAIFGNVQQVKLWSAVTASICAGIAALQGCVTFPFVMQVLKSNSVVSLKKHKESKCNAKCVLDQWRRMHNSGTPAVLVLTDDCLPSLGITDATCVIHFSFPSPEVLGQRLQSTADSFCSDSSVDQEHTKAKSVILLTGSSSCHAPGVLRYLKHAEAEIPEELYDLTAKVLESEQDEKLSRPLCTSLKTFGICRNRTSCPDRHQINSSIDIAQNIILPLLIVHATNYFGRIVKKQKDQYTALAKEMSDYFKIPGRRIPVNAVEKSVFYGLWEGAICHRVQVVETPAKEEENTCKVTVKYIDEGRTSQVNSDQLLHLPVRFQSLPPQAVEIIVCRVKPIDNEVRWNPKVTDHIDHKIKGKLHHAKVVHTLGKTVWVDPMVGVTSLPGMKLWINEYNIRSEILSTGLGTDNPEHVAEIQKLCRQMPILDHAENMEHFQSPAAYCVFSWKM
uniref:RNA helicase n=1 Tax=Malurus cyaneus samueli TaxID=2593467 RepID=A0A8C5T7Q9_9PASS